MCSFDPLKTEATSRYDPTLGVELGWYGVGALADPEDHLGLYDAFDRPFHLF